jgi:xylulose-5-phosphate/fructose-6-phosphate phosphoketolase
MTLEWPELVRQAANRFPDDVVDAARRALDYLCLAQLYLRDNPVLARRLHPADVAERPSGHWGVSPPVNAALAAIGPYRQFLDGIDVRVVHGAGHAAPSALAHAWLTGALAAAEPGYGPNIDGLTRLMTGYRVGHRFGTEITPLLPGHHHLGGQLGPALAVSQGMVLDAPDRLVITLIGDGECETGATAAAWLGARALIDTGSHGRVLPVVLLNGLRMGGPSLLSGLTPEDIGRFFASLGYRAVITTGPDTAAVRTAFHTALAGLRPLDCGPSTVLILTVAKGHGAPKAVSGRAILGTAAIHKTPLRAPRDDPDEFAALDTWLTGYRPHELFGPTGAPHPILRRVLGEPTHHSGDELVAPRGCLSNSEEVARACRERLDDFGTAVARALADLHEVYGLRVFSPDELASNRIHLGDPSPEWAVEVLNEELCHAWAQGYQDTGRRAIVIGYEAFAPIAASLLAQHLTARRLAATAGRSGRPSIVYLLTSLGWNNTISHANPGLIDLAVAAADPTVRVYTPADAARTATTLTYAIRKLDRCTLLLASKHPMPTYPLDTLTAELRDGYGIWRHVADSDQPELVLMSAGDIAARELTTAATKIVTNRPRTRLRYIHIHDLTCLGAPGRRAAAIPDPVFADLVPPGTPMLVTVPCHPLTVHGLLAERRAADRATVIGWQPVAETLTAEQLLRHAGLDAASLTTTALALLDDPTHSLRKEHAHAGHHGRD